MIKSEYNNLKEVSTSTEICTGKEPIGGKGHRRAKRHSRKTNNCPMCDDPTCKLSLKDFLKSIKP